MSDFLKNFSKDNYEKEKVEENIVENEIIEKNKVLKENESSENIDSKQPWLVEKKTKPVNVMMSPKVKHDEEYVIDKNYYRQKNMKYYIIAGISVLLIILFTFLYFNSNKIVMKNFIDAPRTDVETWAEKNKIEVEYKENFKNEIKSGLVYEQSVEAKKVVKKKSILTVFISKGSDPSEKIVVPDIMKSNEEALNKWKNDNYLSNVTIEGVYDPTTPKGDVLSYTFQGTTVSESNYTRGDRLTIKVSRGIEPISKNIKVPDFKGKTSSEVVDWGVANEVEIIQEKKESKATPKDSVVSQSVKAEGFVAKGDKLTIVVSLGEGHEVLNFFSYPKKDVEAKALKAKLTVKIEECYSNTVKYGTMINQSHAAGSIVYVDDVVTLYYSKGKPFVSLSGTEDALNKTVFEMNQEGAEIYINKTYVNASNEPKGTIISVSPNSQFVDVGATINITISNGGKILIPDLRYKDFTSEEVTAILADLTAKGVKVIKEYTVSDYYPNIIISQSIAPWTEMSTGDNVLIIKIDN